LKTIDIDSEVYQKLKESADPFVETSPNDVLRRILGLPTRKPAERGVEMWAAPEAEAGFPQVLRDLRSSTGYVHPAFLTFLIDKHKSIGGGFSTADIIPFMERFRFVTPSGFYRNPWMVKPYGGQRRGKTSCEGSIEQYRQCRHYGCWGGRDSKTGCDTLDCRYHPRNPNLEACVGRNKCDLRKGVIWKRENPLSPYTFGKDYVEVIRSEFLKGQAMPMNLLAGALYPGEEESERALTQFVQEFHVDESERVLFHP
jgi:predicted CopG family antitoxin